MQKKRRLSLSQSVSFVSLFLWVLTGEMFGISLFKDRWSLGRRRCIVARFRSGFLCVDKSEHSIPGPSSAFRCLRNNQLSWFRWAGNSPETLLVPQSKHHYLHKHETWTWHWDNMPRACRWRVTFRRQKSCQKRSYWHLPCPPCPSFFQQTFSLINWNHVHLCFAFFYWFHCDSLPTAFQDKHRCRMYVVVRNSR